MMLRMFKIVVVLATALISRSFAAQSTFISDTQSIAFGLSIPESNNEDLYFSIAMGRGQFWAAVGLGGSKMAGSLVLMIYSSASRDNVTFSPRLATGHKEPELYSSLDYETLPGTGLVNETTYLYNAVCHNCRSWPSGSIDVSSTSQNFIFATGPRGDARSDSRSASVKIHYEYGTFTMDMKRATGSAGPVVLNSTTTDISDGATSGNVTKGMTDWYAMFHAIIMIGCFLGLMPLGVLILRLGGWVRWHGINQTLAAIGIITGVGLGFHAGTLYNRTKKFNTAHQIVGLLVFLSVLAQFVLGFMHHRTFKKTKQPTKFAPVHLWLGRGIIVIGIANGFLGFPLALSPAYSYVLGGLVLLVMPLFVLALLTKRWLVKRRQRRDAENQGPSGYNAEPWRNAVPHTGHSSDANSESLEMGSMRKQ